MLRFTEAFPDDRIVINADETIKLDAFSIRKFKVELEAMKNYMMKY